MLAVSVNNADSALPLSKIALDAHSKNEPFWVDYIDDLIKAKRIDDGNEFIGHTERPGVPEDRMPTLRIYLPNEPQKTSYPFSMKPAKKLINTFLKHY